MKTIQLNMSKNENSLLVLPNAINKARFTMSLPTQKLFLHLVSKITYEERKEGKFLNTLEFSLEEIYSFLQMTGRENSKDLKGLLKNCVSEIGRNNLKYSQFDDLGKEYWAEYPWSAKSEIREDRGKFIFAFNDRIAWFLLDLQSYFKSNIKEYMKLSSSHSISLYLLFRSNEFKNKIQSYYLEDLKKHLGVEDKYQDYRNLKIRVLDPSIEQLNKETNYFFSYEAKRIGRSIGRIEIRIIDKKNNEEFSDFLSEKIQVFIKEKKADIQIRKGFGYVKYEYNAKENFLYINFKDEDSKYKIEGYYMREGLKGTEALSQFLDGFISVNKDFQKFLKTMFRKGVKVYYGKK